MYIRTINDPLENVFCYSIRVIHSRLQRMVRTIKSEGFEALD